MANLLRDSQPHFPPISVRNNGYNPNSTSISTCSNKNQERRNSVGLLREQINQQQHLSPDVAHVQIPQNIELKLSQNINASKFNRRRYPTQTDYEYASPKPELSSPSKLQSPMKQQPTSFHQIAEMESDIASRGMMFAHQIKVVDNGLNETRGSLFTPAPNTQSVMNQSFAVPREDPLLTKQQLNAPSVKKLEQTMRSPRSQYLHANFASSQRHDGVSEFPQPSIQRPIVVDSRLEALPTSQIMQSMQSMVNPFSHKQQYLLGVQQQPQPRIPTNVQMYTSQGAGKGGSDSNRVSPMTRMANNQSSVVPGANDTSSVFNSQINAFSSTASIINAQNDDDYTREQLQKILKKRMRGGNKLKDSRNMLPQGQQHRTIEVNQKRNNESVTMMTYVQSASKCEAQKYASPLEASPYNQGKQLYDSLKVEENHQLQKSIDQDRMSTDSESSEEDDVNVEDEERALLARQERKAQKEKERRERERKLYLERMKNKMPMSKAEAQAKIQQFSLATEKRAQDRLNRLNGVDDQENEKNTNKKKINVFDTKTVGGLANYLKSKLAEAKLAQQLKDNNELLIKDREETQFRYKMPDKPDSDRHSDDTMHSFYSQNGDVTSNFHYNQSIKSGKKGQKTPATKPATATTMNPIPDEGSDEDGDKQEEDQEARRPDPVIPADVEKQRKLAEVAQFEKEQTEQVELCGEEFIEQLQGMIDALDQYIVPINNGNTKDNSVDTSELSLQEKQLLDTSMPKKFVHGFTHLVKNQAAFFEKAKRVDEPKFQHLANQDEKISYYQECLKSHVLCFPMMNRVHNHNLVIQKSVLNEGLCFAIQAVLFLMPDLLWHLTLDSNSLTGARMQTILEGLIRQNSLKSLTIQDNEIDDQSVEYISQLARRRPDHLDHLNIFYCRIGWTQTENLLKALKQGSNLRSLSLVKVSLNEHSMPLLEGLVEKSKRLTNLDISWNSLMPRVMKKLLEGIAANRRLQYINLAWNNLVDSSFTDKEQIEICTLLGQVVKRNKQLLHFDLTSTGLTNLIIKEMGSHIRRAPSMLVVHLSDNPGLSDENLDYLPQRIKCRPAEDIERFARIQNLVVNFQTGVPQQLVEGIVRKMNNMTTFQKQLIEPSQKLVFQRMIGLKQEQPGSGQWFESSQATVSNKKHYKNDCWICEKHVYSVILWSRGRAFLLNPVFNKDQSGKLVYEIDFIPQDVEEEEDPGLGHVSGNVSYDQLENKIPYLCGSFTGWRYKKMVPLHEFNQGMDKERKDPFEQCKANGTIKFSKTKDDDLTTREKTELEIMASKQRKNYRVHWAKYFNKYLMYKNPYIINGAQFHQIDDELDMINLHGKNGKRVLMASDSEDNLKAKSPKVVDDDEVPDNRPKIPDENKWDIIYCLPLFAKPGKHTYMIKFKNTQERNQAKVLKQRQRVQEQMDAAVEQGHDTNIVEATLRQIETGLKPECFFYTCNVVPRVEPLQVQAKTISSKTVTRKFVKHTSVFKNWHEEKPSKNLESIEIDCKLWKIAKFIKEGGETEIEACKQVVIKYSELIKQVFINLQSQSTYPAIQSMVIGNWVTKLKIADDKLSVGDVDRFFKGAYFKPTELIKFSIIGNALVRYEFLELLVRISSAKYKDLSFSEGFTKLLKEKIAPYDHEPWQTFRDKHLWTIEVNDILEANLKNLEKIYANYFTPVKKFIVFEDVIDMVVKTGNLGISEIDIQFCYGMSKMVISNEPQDYKKYTVMLFPEFLEMIGRLSDYKFKNSDMSSESLAQKIEWLLEELCPAYGLTKKDVNVGQEDNSESDDDY